MNGDCQITNKCRGKGLIKYSNEYIPPEEQFFFLTELRFVADFVYNMYVREKIELCMSCTLDLSIVC